MDFRVAGFSMSKEVWFITQNEFKQVFEQQVDRCRVLLTRKTKEYTGDNADRLSAFKAAAALQSCTPERALAGMLAKHRRNTACHADNLAGVVQTQPRSLCVGADRTVLPVWPVHRGQNVLRTPHSEGNDAFGYFAD